MTGRKPIWNVCKICGKDYRDVHSDKLTHLQSHGLNVRGDQHTDFTYWFTKEQYVE